jgi:hypothetical protein
MTPSNVEQLDPERWLRMQTNLPFVKIVGNQVVPMEPQDWVLVWRDATLRAPVPAEIMLRFEQARACIAYGCFFYPLYGLGMGQLLRVADLALLSRCNQLGAPKAAFAKRIEWLYSSGLQPDFDKAYWHRLRLCRNEDTHEAPAMIMTPGAAQAFLAAITEEIQRLFDEPNINRVGDERLK